MDWSPKICHQISLSWQISMPLSRNTLITLKSIYIFIPNLKQYRGFHGQHSPNSNIFCHNFLTEWILWSTVHQLHICSLSLPHFSWGSKCFVALYIGAYFVTPIGFWSCSILLPCFKPQNQPLGLFYFIFFTKLNPRQKIICFY